VVRAYTGIVDGKFLRNEAEGSGQWAVGSGQWAVSYANGLKYPTLRVFCVLSHSFFLLSTDH